MMPYNLIAGYELYVFSIFLSVFQLKKKLFILKHIGPFARFLKKNTDLSYTIFLGAFKILLFHRFLHVECCMKVLVHTVCS